MKHRRIETHGPCLVNIKKVEHQVFSHGDHHNEGDAGGYHRLDQIFSFNPEQASK